MMHWMHAHPLWLAGGILAGLTALVSLAPVEFRQEVLAPQGEQARYGFGDSRSVGQSFAPIAGLSSITIPIGQTENAHGPLLLHLRNDYFGPDVREASVFQVEGETATFQFSPLVQVPERLTWVLEAPHSDDRSYWAYREFDDSAYAQGDAFVKGQPLVGNFAFTMTGRQLLLRVFVSTFQEDFTARSWEWAALGMGLLTAGGAWVVWPLGRQMRLEKSWLPGAVLTSLILHIWMAWRFPGVIDEGAYLMDAWQTTSGFLPFRDFLTKGPLYIVLLKIWQVFLPNSLELLRTLSPVAWAAVVWLSARLSDSLGLPRAGQIVVAWALAILPAAVTLSTPLLLQVVSTALIVGGVWLAVRSAQQGKANLAVFSALVLVAAYFVRSSSLVGFLVAGCIFFLWKRQWRLLAVFVSTSAVVLGMVFVLGVGLMGFSKTAVMFNLEAVLISQQWVAGCGGKGGRTLYPRNSCAGGDAVAGSAVAAHGNALGATVVAQEVIANRKDSGRNRLGGSCLPSFF